jgi:predicted MPP superfamily phosphohydrolase
MFGSVLTVAYTALLVYVLWRAASVPLLARRLSRKGFVGLGTLLWAVFFLAMVVGHRGSGPAAKALESVGMVLLGSAFLISTVLFAVDLGTVFGRALPSWTPMLRGWGIVVGIVLSSIALVQGFRAPAVVSYEVTLPRLPTELDGTVFVAASDAHLGAHLGEQWLTERVGEIQAPRPDIVVFLGDMFEGHGDAPREFPALRQLSVPLGKWFVDGNHESHRTVGADALEQAGFRRLASQWAEPAPGLVLAGVSDLTHHKRRALDGDPLERALANRPTGATVLLSHTPWEADRAAHAGVELMLSGHTHGGQIWPFGYLVQTVYPLLAGRYDIDGMPVIVGRGTGTWGPRMRLWRRGEILKVTLRTPQRTRTKGRPAGDPPAR